MKRILGNLLVLSLSLTLSVLAAELMARHLVDPIDYLQPALVTDEFLDFRIGGHTGAHDAWGFRNQEVPGAADIVCIGDSMTYGFAARAVDSWPAVLGAMRGDRVYSMAVPGYGPIQYLQLMRTRALELHPKIVVVGVYLGNDFMDAYNMVRFNKNWRTYGDIDPSVVQGPPSIVPRDSGPVLAGVRNWLSQRSVLYVMLTQPLFSALRTRRIMAGAEGDASYRIAFRDQNHTQIFDFDPRFLFLNVSDSRIKAGMEITKRALLDVADVGKRDQIRVVIALIPTKVRVYGALVTQAGYLDANSRVRGKERLTEALRQEDVVREELAGFLREQHLEVVDLLPALSRAVAKGDLYPLTDPHPDKAGYRVIAETINRYLNDVQSGSKAAT